MTNKADVLITGGTGFLGIALAKKYKALGYKVLLGGRDQKRALEAKSATGCETVPLDVVNIESVRDAVVEAKPWIIIHAAAGKFVDLAETQPAECIEVNVLGSLNVARVAMERGVDAVIGISTDKAAPPVRNTYGLSKAMMERTFASMAGRSATRFVSVRYGNVAWSTGSVLPIWKQMHDTTGIIKTTGPHMRRFFFTVDDAVSLVVGAVERYGEYDGMILTRDMKSAKIEDLLNVWCDRLGGSWEVVDGRPGERTDEYLVGESETSYAERTVFGDILISPNTLSKHPINHISTATAERLTKDEMAVLISMGGV